MSDLSSLIINSLILYGAIQALFIAFVLTVRGNKLTFNKLFAMLLIIEGISLIERLLVESELITTMPHLLGVSYPLSFLKPPLLLLMTISITSKDFSFRLRVLLHAIPAMLIFISTIPFYSMSGEDKLKSIHEFVNKVPSYSNFEFYFALSFFLYIGIYILLSIGKLNKYRRYILNNPLVNWYRKILYFYVGFLGIHLAYFLAQPLLKTNFDLINQLSLLLMTFILQSIFFVLISKSTLLNSKIDALNSPNEREEKLNLIINELEKGKVFLDDELSLDKFAKRIALPSKEVSRIVNQNFNLSFQKLVSRYRVNEAKTLMESGDLSQLKLIDIAFQSGFNNKVSFYRSFKAHEGISPSEYLKRLI